MSDGDQRLQCKHFKEPFGTRWHFSSSYHPETVGQASKNINGSNSSELEPVVLHDLRPAFAFEESMELPVIDVMIALAENPT